MRKQESLFVLKLPSDWTFFGLTYEYNQRVFEQIFDMAFYGQGGFTYTDLYHMPVNLRSFYYTKLADIMEKRHQDAEEAKKSVGRRRKF